MKVKTADLIATALDWAVAKSLGLSVVTVTVEDQAAEHERVMRDHYSDTELQEYLIEWNKHVRPALRTRLAVLDSEGFPNGNPFMQNGRGVPLAFSTDWSQGGPIIGREHISVDNRKGDPCLAFKGTPAHYEFSMFAPEGQPLIAAMRCFVASKLGDEIEIPEELLKESP